MNKEMTELLKNGKLIQGIILDTEGMIVEAAGDRYDTELLTSLFFHFQNFIDSSRENLKLDRLDEVSLITEKEQLKITFRSFSIDEMELFLIAIYPTASSSGQSAHEIIPIFQERLKSILGDRIVSKPLHVTQEDTEKTLDDSHSVYEKEMIGSMKAAGLTIDMKEEVEKIKEEIIKEELPIEGNSSSQISEKAVDQISYKIFQKLSSNVVEKMVQKIVLQIADNLKKIAENE